MLTRKHALRAGLALLVTTSASGVADVALADEMAGRSWQSAVRPLATAPGTEKAPAAKRLKIAERPKKTAESGWSSDWLYDLVARVIDPAPASQPRRPHIVRAATQVAAKPAKPIATTAAPSVVPQPDLPAPVSASSTIEASLPAAPRAFPAKPAAEPNTATAAVQVTPVSPRAPATPTVTPPPLSPITTGSIAPVLPPKVVSPSASDALMSAAERAQSVHDLTKLELANRAYGEIRPSGAMAFDLRKDWRVLERARDAMSSAELAAATAAGFDASAYLNEYEGIIVVAVAGTQDLRRNFLTADIWQALIRAESPQHFFMAKSYIRSVMMRYQMRGYTTECVGHSLGGGACAYAASELGIRAIVVNPIAAGRLAPGARYLVRNYIVDGDIAQFVYEARGNAIIGDIVTIPDGQDEARLRTIEKLGPLAGPILIVRDLKQSVLNHSLVYALDRIAEQSGIARPR